MTELVGILDYGCGNIKSVSNAINAIGADYKIIENSREIESVSKLILPGVGAFDVAMSSLDKTGMIEMLNTFVENPENKLLGICLGMQLICNGSEEGRLPGLGYINSEVMNLKNYSNLKVPHIGWNTVKFTRQNPLLEDLMDGTDYYFVHSYCVMTEDESVILGETIYGPEFVSIVHKGNVWGVQFHPEKSQGTGLKLLKNFIELC